MRTVTEIQSDLDKAIAVEKADTRPTRGADGKQTSDAELIRIDRLQAKNHRRALEAELEEAKDEQRAPPRAAAIVQNDLDAVNHELGKLRATARALALELEESRVAEQVAAMPDEKRRALEKALRRGTTIGAGSVASGEKFGKMGSVTSS